MAENVTARSPIWWLASYPKSGNTWVRAFLSSYIFGVSDINRLGNRFMLGDMQKYYYQAVSPIPLDELSTNDVFAIRGAALMHMAAAVGEDYCPFVLKTHAALDPFGVICPPSLTAAGIVIVRDPRDVAISYAKHMGKSLDEAIEGMNEEVVLSLDDAMISHPVRSWSKFYESWCNPTLPIKRLILKYEDMLSVPEKCFKDLLKFMRVDFNEDNFQRALADTKFDKLKEQESNGVFVEASIHAPRDFFSRGTSGHWREVLTKEQSDQIEKDHGEVMEAFGYDLESKAKEAA